MWVRVTVALLAAAASGALVWFALEQIARAPSATPPAEAVGAVAGDAGGAQGVAPSDARDATRAATTRQRPAEPPGNGAGIAEATTPVAGATLAIPVAGVSADTLVDSFGDRRGDGRPHEALDIMAPAGTPVVAVADGHVEKLFHSERGGLTVYQFEPSGRHAYYYAHLQAYAPGLHEGQRLRRGQVIGRVGSSGNADPAAPHLHFAVFELGPAREWWRGTPVNPYPLLVGR